MVIEPMGGRKNQSRQNVAASEAINATVRRADAAVNNTASNKKRAAVVGDDGNSRKQMAVMAPMLKREASSTRKLAAGSCIADFSV